MNVSVMGRGLKSVMSRGLMSGMSRGLMSGMKRGLMSGMSRGLLHRHHHVEESVARGLGGGGGMGGPMYSVATLTERGGGA